jgi:putative ABC transport system permease protein
MVRKVTGVTAVAPLSAVLGTPHGQHGDYTGGLVVATTPELPGLLNQSMAYGMFLTADDNGQMAAVLGQQAAQALFDDSVPLGRSFTFRGREFIVRGIFNDFNNTPLSEQADFNKAIFIPYDVGQVMTNGSAPTYEILAKTSGKHTHEVANSITETLKKSHGGQADFNVLQQNQNIAQSDDIVGLLTVMISVVAGISLLVGGIGIMNVMLVTVTERMREIGIRKAVGATNRQILGQFLVEATLLSFTGGIIGIALACLVDLGLGVFTDLRPVIQWQVVVLAAGVSLLIGILFGSLPALKAARKDPIAALRAE